MPFRIEVRHTVAEAVAQSLGEVHLKQAIFNVRVTPLATGARVRFDTAFPAFAMVERPDGCTCSGAMEAAGFGTRVRSSEASWGSRG